MKANQWWRKRVAQLGLILMMGVSMGANAGWFGFGGDSWKEEVLLHDGSKIIVKRSQSYGGRHEIGQAGTVKEQEITFTVPNTNKPLTFKSEYTEDIGGRNFYLLALHILNGTPYVIAEPWLCLSYNKWGRPNPPYVIFKHNGKEWQRIPLSELPPEFKDMNLLIETRGYDVEKIIASQPIVTAEIIKEQNGELTQYRYKTILREPYPGAAGSCGVMIYDGKGGWNGVGIYGKTYESCLAFCAREKISPQYCPCDILFKGNK